MIVDSDLNDSLSWSITGLPDGLILNNEKSTIEGSIKKAGNYTIKITATDKSLSSISMTYTITVTNTTEVSDIDLFSPSVYPIPVKDQLWIKQSVSSGSRVQIFNMHGKLFIDLPVVTNPIDISLLSKGIYIVKFFNAEKVSTEKIIKE